MLSQHSDLTSFGISANQAKAKGRFSPDVGLHVRRPVLPEQAQLDAGAANHRDLVQRHDDVLACEQQNGLVCNLYHQLTFFYGAESQQAAITQRNHDGDRINVYRLKTMAFSSTNQTRKI